jgi:hypothetical protein
MRDPLTNKMFGATLLSGALSGITFMSVPGALSVGPGLLFGVATALVLRTVKWLDPVQGLLWAFASTGAWYLAIRNYTAHVSTSGPQPYSALINMLVAGLIGSVILAIAFSLLARKVSLIGPVITVACGVLLAGAMYAVLSAGSDTELGGSSSILSYAKLAAAFAIWQVGTGLSLLVYKSSSNLRAKSK